MIKTTFQDFFQFIKKPDDRQIKLNFSNKLSLSLILFITQVIFTYIIILPLLEKIDDMLELKPVFDIHNLTVLKSFFFLVIIIPFLEELIFRYFLRYEGKKTRIISHHQWKKIFPFLVYFLTICFGLVHLSNFTNSSNWFYILSPFVIISQLIGGFIITYLRVRLNFFWGVFYHWTWNFLFVIAIPAVEGFLGIV